MARGRRSTSSSRATRTVARLTRCTCTGTRPGPTARWWRRPSGPGSAPTTSRPRAWAGPGKASAPSRWPSPSCCSSTTCSTRPAESALARYRVDMMPSPSAFDGEQTVSASTPREIRAALIGEEIAHFDREYRRAMADAAESLDLSGVVSMLKRWQRVAWSTQDDPEAHRHMLACADELSAGGDVATEPWQRTKARLGL